MGEESIINLDRRKRLDWASYSAGFEDAAGQWESLCPNPGTEGFTAADIEFLKELKVKL